MYAIMDGIVGVWRSLAAGARFCAGRSTDSELPVARASSTAIRAEASGAPGARAQARGSGGPRKLRRDLRTLILFVETYCAGKHDRASRNQKREAGEFKCETRQPAKFASHDVERLNGRLPRLCPACRRLLAHALVMRTRCPYDPKPMCKHCPTHCYAPNYRAQIREVMRYSGRRLLMTGRVHYLVHLVK